VPAVLTGARFLTCAVGVARRMLRADSRKENYGQA
jgi:hypothetical protein